MGNIEKSFETQRLILQVASKVAHDEYMALVEPKFISKPQAIRMYKGFVAMWEREKLIKPLRSENGREIYQANRLAELWYMHQAGI